MRTEDEERYFKRVKEYSDNSHKVLDIFKSSGFTDEQAMQILLTIISKDDRRFE